MLELLKWLPLLPIIAQYPKLERDVATHMPEAQEALKEIQDLVASAEAQVVISKVRALMTKHAEMLKLFQEDAPSAVALNNALAPTVKQILERQSAVIS